MRAAALTSVPATRLELRDVEPPLPGARELLLDVEACGICGTDLHIIQGGSYRPTLPFVLGHEPIGRVAAVGEHADPSWVGRRVTMTLFTGCGRCAQCLAGDERLCRDLGSIVGVLAAPGGFAEQMVIPAVQAVPVPDALDSATAATLVDAGATAANAVRSLGSRPERAVVVGGGPLGFFVAELLRADGVPVVIVQPSQVRREALAALGHEVVASIGEAPTGVDAVIDCAGAPEALPWAVDALGPQGAYVAAGYGPVEHLDLAPASHKELVVRGVRSGRREDLERMLALVARGGIRVPPISRWPLAAINEALDALRRRTVPGKAVIDVNR
jgi:propanol-preferring alcohol dehydrogenase